MSNADFLLLTFCTATFGAVVGSILGPVMFRAMLSWPEIVQWLKGG